MWFPAGGVAQYTAYRTRHFGPFWANFRCRWFGAERATGVGGEIFAQRRYVDGDGAHDRYGTITTSPFSCDHFLLSLVCFPFSSLLSFVGCPLCCAVYRPCVTPYSSLHLFRSSFLLCLLSPSSFFILLLFLYSILRLPSYHPVSRTRSLLL